MIRATVKLLLLSLAVTVRMEDEFEEPEDARSVPPKMDIAQFFLPNENQFYDLLRRTNATEPGDDSVLSKLKEEAGVLLKTIEDCRERYPSMSNETLNQQLYNGLLSELLGMKTEASEAVLRRCNITEEFLSKLKAKVFQLDILQDVFVLFPRNNSSGSSSEEGKITEAPETRIRPQRTAGDSNLRLKLGDEWLQADPKMSHLSHIYLGSSLYPILTEESRVLVKDRTSPTLPEVQQRTENSAVDKEAQISSAEMETPLREITHGMDSPPGEEGRKLKTVLRLPRSIRRNTPINPESDSPAEIIDNYEDAPQRLNLLPRNSDSWEVREVDEDNKGTEDPLNEDEFSTSPLYQMIHKLCAKILQRFKNFLKAQMLKIKAAATP